MARQIFEISPNTYRVEDDFVRFFILVGDEQAAVIDTGVSGNGVIDLVRTITDKKIILINTHGDGDHTSGNGEFEEFYIHKSDYDVINIGERFPESKPVFVEDGQVIDLGNRPLEIIAIPGHTKGSIAILDKNNRALFSGDTVQSGHIFMFGPHRDKDAFEGSLCKLLERKSEFDVIYPCHDKFDLEGDYVSKVLECWKQYQNGELTGEDIELHGQKVKSYTAEFCGFFI